MTIPPFDDNGNLPPGIHYCTWEEFIKRFKTSQSRARLIQGLSKAMEQLKAAGCKIIYVDGSFVTEKKEPRDFDACWETDGVDFNYLKMYAPTLLNFYDKRQSQKAIYRGELFLYDSILDEEKNLTALDVFQVDKDSNRKGIIAIDLVMWQP